MKKYYLKLTLLKGQFDGAYSCSQEIQLSKFQCKIIEANFEKITERSKIIFEIKNGNGDEDIIISRFVFSIFS